jgi:hypothetical protein
VLDLGGRGVEDVGDAVGGAGRAGDRRAEPFDHERGGIGGLPVEVVVPHVHEPGVGRQRDPGAVHLLGTAEHDVDVVARAEPEGTGADLGRHARATALGGAPLDLEDELPASPVTGAP